MQRHRICTANRFLNVSTVLCMMSMMSAINPYDYQQQAEAAMSMALAATGSERQKWVQVALAWWNLSRNAADPGRALGSGQQGLPRAESLADLSAGAANIRMT
jgi:hypothetical protein